MTILRESKKNEDFIPAARHLHCIYGTQTNEEDKHSNVNERRAFCMNERRGILTGIFIMTNNLNVIWIGRTYNDRVEDSFIYN